MGILCKHNVFNNDVIGGCSGSTTGGLKIFRIQVLWALVIKELKTIRSPRAISNINLKNININENIINSVMIIFFCFIFSVFLLQVFLYYGYDFITSISAAVTSVSVVGPGLGNIIGPEESFAQLPSTQTIIIIWDGFRKIRIFSFFNNFSAKILD